MSQQPDGTLASPEAEHPEGYLHSEYSVDPGQTPMRIDRYLALRLEGTSRAFIQKALDDNLVLVNGKPVKASYRIKPLEHIALYQRTPPRDNEVRPEPIPLDIVFEDEHLLIVNKPAGMVVHPGHGHFSGTLINALLYHLQDLPLFQKGDLRPGLAHRIDKDTSGLVAVGKTELAMKRLSQQFLAKSTTRQYIALAWGSFTEDQGTITGNLARDPSNRQRMRTFDDPAIGKSAVTHWRVVERLPFLTLIACQLETGRMHQIRVHMQHANHPLFNDARYGGEQILRGVDTPAYRLFVQQAFSICPRQALHAGTLGLQHPITGEPLHFEVPLPDDMQNLLDYWRQGAIQFI